jgi:hypothetical protein
LEEVSVENDFTDYEVFISENFMLFDKAIFRIFGSKKDISGATSFNLIFDNSNQPVTMRKIQHLVDTISEVYGKDRNGKSRWTGSDGSSISKYWEGREWIIDIKGNSYSDFGENCIQINFHYDSGNGVSLSILGANALVNK